MLNHTILDFLKILLKNNNRDWFHANKEWYNKVKQEFELFVNVLIAEISRFDPSVRTINAKECLYRIYRDTRFSKDKTPYKTNLGAHIVKNGRKSGLAGYYLHVEPGECFVAGGIYMPPSHILKSVRKSIFENTEDFKNILSNTEFHEYFPEIYGNKLKSVPRDFPPGFLDANLLKYKSYTLFKYYPDDIISSKDYLPFIVGTFKLMAPFNHFINDAIIEKYGNG